LAFVSIHPFGAQKGAKGTAQTKSVTLSSAHKFSQAKIFLVRRSLVGNFPHRKTTRECVSLAAPRRAKKTFTLLSAPFLCPLPVILTVLYFLKVTFALLIAKQK
jgi:hypothetical protein